MKILFASNAGSSDDSWIDLLQTALPNTEIVSWNETNETSGAELAIVWRPDATLLSREPNLKAIFNLGAGVDGILKLPGLHYGLEIYRLEDAGMAVQMAEYCTHAVLDASRRFADYRALQAQGQWKTMAPIQRHRWPIGVLGLGLMGERVAQTLSALEYPVSGWSRSQKSIPGIQCFAGSDTFEAFLKQTRVLINILPLTPETHGILNKETLSQLLPNAYVINVARGEHLVDDDLLALMDAGHIDGATLDVFTEEPLPAAHPFWTHPKVTITPHIAAASLRDQTVAQISDKIRAWSRGETVSGRVNLQTGY